MLLVQWNRETYYNFSNYLLASDYDMGIKTILALSALLDINMLNTSNLGLFFNRNICVFLKYDTLDKSSCISYAVDHEKRFDIYNPILHVMSDISKDHNPTFPEYFFCEYIWQ